MKQDFSLPVQFKVNEALARWNPISVEPDIALDEYKGYVSKIIKSADTKESLLRCLEDILVDQLGLEYDSNNNQHRKDLENISIELLSIIKSKKV